jgi:hypothetical protein
LLSLLADVEARRGSALRLGLEDGVREVLLRGGDASRVWPLNRTIAVIDEVLQRPILATLAERYRAPAETRPSLDLAALFTDLGVIREGDGVRFVDSAPLAHVRRAITYGRLEE